MLNSAITEKTRVTSKHAVVRIDFPIMIIAWTLLHVYHQYHPAQQLISGIHRTKSMIQPIGALSSILVFWTNPLLLE